ncbi:hypothetical protein DSCW_05490 [Desulfosarcina widdelii]|uniref:Uncharacterized protein n=1 Tax=Desulfosarcina widdelii TaxID=947919 RepID=A0A5K7YTF8_9BACT|nr:hypothetical protein DSCW_05490 [Desulfosarcina widdelii]
MDRKRGFLPEDLDNITQIVRFSADPVRCDRPPTSRIGQATGIFRQAGQKFMILYKP